MKKEEFENVLKILNEMYPNITVSLNFNSAFELLFCLILAAQCTDKRVNEVTKNIFNKYNTPEDFANMELKKIEQMIKPCGFYITKAKNIQKASQQLIQNFNSIVPNNMEKLQTLAGIGRKSANCILSDVFHNPQGVAIDTHAKRICNRLGISNHANPLKIEKDLLKIADKKYWQNLNLIFVTHGRQTCKAIKPNCEQCGIKQYCNYYIDRA